jgi:hypothetical protein
MVGAQSISFFSQTELPTQIFWGVSWNIGPFSWKQIWLSGHKMNIFSFRSSSDISYRGILSNIYILRKYLYNFLLLRLWATDSIILSVSLPEREVLKVASSLMIFCLVPQTSLTEKKKCFLCQPRPLTLNRLHIIISVDNTINLNGLSSNQLPIPVNSTLKLNQVSFLSCLLKI